MIAVIAYTLGVIALSMIGTGICLYFSLRIFRQSIRRYVKGLLVDNIDELIKGIIEINERHRNKENDHRAKRKGKLVGRAGH
jgi:uncharacterized membrane protein